MVNYTLPTNEDLHRQEKRDYWAAMDDAARATNPVDRADALERAKGHAATCRHYEAGMGLK